MSLPLYGSSGEIPFQFVVYICNNNKKKVHSNLCVYIYNRIYLLFTVNNDQFGAGNNKTKYIQINVNKLHVQWMMTSMKILLNIMVRSIYTNIF